MDCPASLRISPASITPSGFTASGFEALFPCAGTLGCMVCLVPQLFLLVYPHTNVGLSGLPAAALSYVLSTLCCLFPPLLPVRMNVSFLIPWLLDFHTVRSSGSSGCFLFLNWLLSFFWLCEEALFIYLCLHLCQKSQFFLVYIQK